MSLERQPENEASLARLAAGAAWHTTGWAVSTGFGLGRRLVRAASSPEQAVEFASDVATAARVLVNGVASVAMKAADNGTAEGSREAESQPLRRSNPLAASAQRPAREAPEKAVDLRKQGAELLQRSRDVWNESSAHPAYGRILTELAPDEGRILLLLMRSGPQATVDVRTGGPVGMVSSDLVAAGLNMIGPRAGLRYVDQVPSYLNNLFRLGLIWYSKEQLKDPLEYQVVEAQPDVLEAMHSVRFPKMVRRSIHLTPFGEDFCRTCLLDEDEATAEHPEHNAPQDLD
ncbi:Abi-alpha family protein [Nocardioides sp. AE5]|uniref:Abi-alpha family protein n=1 Tax=Nocardioides sp. AE5 TaxID=2962573 RepID=UPI0028820EE1|nr:Abi-alpha family protein [Nocardioides sp. AE5]MDT0200332.1 Abi-alpha family protein [Nocardioides sp. AE5]